MSESPDAQFTQANMVRFERTIHAASDAIWSMLVDTSCLPGWYGKGRIEGRVGGAVSLMDGHIRGTVTQWLPMKKLAYTWNVFALSQTVSDFPESYLTLELDGDRLTLMHLPVLEEFVKLNAVGWHAFLDMVDAAARDAPVEPRENYMKRAAKRYGVRPA
ncbi:MAG: SRPBCC domain-containing protein [Reyranellales bacterium]